MRINTKKHIAKRKSPIYAGANLSHLVAVLLCSVSLSGCSSGDSGPAAIAPTANESPVSDAGPDQLVDEGELVQLDGTGSSDPDSDTLNYLWLQTLGPTVVLLNPNTATPSFQASTRMSAAEDLVFSLTVNDGRADSADDEVTVTILPAPEAANGLRTTITSVLSRGRFTSNNAWTRADLIAMDISAAIEYQKTPKTTNVGPYTVSIVEYEERKRQCQEDYKSLHPRVTEYSPRTGPGRTYTIQDRKCYPKLEEVYYNDPSYVGDPVATQTFQRYGYYCGGGYGGGFSKEIKDPNDKVDTEGEVGTFHEDKPEPLDGIDFCCRLHDIQAWASDEQFANECGIAMCLRHVTVQGITALPADVEEARQYWYGGAIEGGAALVCKGDQFNDAIAPLPE